jgi:outer membrane receptor protein involved in Fe transport
VVGFDGEIIDGWTYDAYGSYYYTTLFQSNLNYLSLTRIARALDVVDTDPGAGVNPQCRSVVDGSDPGCVPYNIFADGGVTPEAVDYLNSLGTAQGSTAEQIVSASLVGDLGESMGFTSPWASDGVQVAIGFEYRRDTFDFDPDQAELSGDLSGFGGAAAEVHDGFDVLEFYGEVRAPLVQERPLAYELSLEAGYRYSDYNTAAGAVDTYKFGGNYAPVEGLRFRASFQHAIKAPSVTQLFTPALENLTSTVSSDPCATHVATLAQCLNTNQNSPLSDAEFTNLYNNFLIADCPAGQCGALLGGNDTLTPEAADTTSIGFTVTPRLLPGFTGSIDWYRIELDNLIGALGANLILQQCLNTGQALWCDLISRNGGGNIWGLHGYLDLRGANAGTGTFEGVDVQANYTFDVGDMGSLSLALNGAYLSKATAQQNPAVSEYDCAGLFGAVCATVNPEWRHNLRVSWDSPWDLLLSLNWRHIGEADLDTNSHQPGLEPFTDDVFSATLESKDYIDLAGIWDISEHFIFRAGVNNVGDVDPQVIDNLITGTGTPNAYPTYDLLGRVFFFGITARY